MFKLLQSSYSVFRSGTSGSNCLSVLKRYSSYLSSKPIPTPDELPKYEVCRDEKLWQYVERLLPDKFIPAPPPTKKELPCGWKPPKLRKDMPFIVQRTKNHMVPVYLVIKQRGQKRRTIIKNIYGDAWLLANKLKDFLQRLHPDRVIGMKLHEASGKIIIHGDHVSDVKLWLDRRGY